MNIFTKFFTPGECQPVFVIAEAGVNHNGSLDLAHRLVDAAAECGADAVKFQSFRADSLVTVDAPKASYQHATTPHGESQREMLRALELSKSDHLALMAHCRARSIAFLSTPFDEISSEMLITLGVDAFKVGSGELTNLPFLAHLAKLERPIILSTGMGDMEEVGAAVKTLEGVPLILLHCVSCYPTQPAQCNLRAMQTMKDTFGTLVGWSDHTLGTVVALAAVALGASVVEKHITLDRTLPGPDHAMSLEPSDMSELIAGIRTVEASLGDGVKKPVDEEWEMRRIARRSLAAMVDIPPGAAVTPAMLGALRPGTGLSPGNMSLVIGRKTRTAIPKGTLLTWDMLDTPE